MYLLVFTDIHGNDDAFLPIESDISQADLIILAGDITHFGGKSEILPVLNHLSSVNTNILAVHGNCDYPQIIDELEQNKISLHLNVIIQSELQFAGIGGSIPCPGRTPSEYSEEEMDQMLKSLESQLDPDINTIFVSHQPPFNTKNDMLPNGIHVGSRSVRNFIDRVQPMVCLTGHIHEGVGIDFIGETKIINPGPFRHGNYLAMDIAAKINSIEYKSVYN